MKFSAPFRLMMIILVLLLFLLMAPPAWLGWLAVGLAIYLIIRTDTSSEVDRN